MGVGQWADQGQEGRFVTPKLPARYLKPLLVWDGGLHIFLVIKVSFCDTCLSSNFSLDESWHSYEVLVT